MENSKYEHDQNRRVKIDPTVKLNNIEIDIVRYLTVWADSASTKLEELPFKQDLRYWNNGPTSMRPLKTYALYKYFAKQDRWGCVGVYEIWERQDGWYKEVYFYKEIEDYEDYTPSQKSPIAIEKEIGLCQNYHLGQ